MLFLLQDFCSFRELTVCAIRLVNQCHASDSNRTQNILLANEVVFGSQSPIITALETSNTEFFSEEPCHKSVQRAYMGKLDSNESDCKVF